MEGRISRELLQATREDAIFSNFFFSSISLGTCFITPLFGAMGNRVEPNAPQDLAANRWKVESPAIWRPETIPLNTVSKCSLETIFLKDQKLFNLGVPVRRHESRKSCAHSDLSIVLHNEPDCCHIG